MLWRTGCWRPIGATTPTLPIREPCRGSPGRPAAATSPEVAAIYEANTAEAIERSVFGSPTYFVDGDMFYGQDHLELVARALKQPFQGVWPRPQTA